MIFGKQNLTIDEETQKEIKSFKIKIETQINKFYLNTASKIEYTPFEYKNLPLPLARIKRLMKSEEDVRVIAADVPMLFSKITEIFIEDLTIRSWLSTEFDKRRIIQTNDVCTAASECDFFDFLVYLIPRDDSEDSSCCFFVNDKKFFGNKSSNTKNEKFLINENDDSEKYFDSIFDVDYNFKVNVNEFESLKNDYNNLNFNNFNCNSYNSLNNFSNFNNYNNVEIEDYNNLNIKNINNRGNINKKNINNRGNINKKNINKKKDVDLNKKLRNNEFFE